MPSMIVVPERWHVQVVPPPLRESDVHVWRMGLNPAAERVAQLRAALSAEEAEHAARLRFEKHRRRYTVYRGAQRVILARYLATPPHRLTFAMTAAGKPYLEDRDGRQLVCFNLSHSGELAVLAVARDRRVGIDIERLRPLDGCEQLAMQFFSAEETAALRALPAAEQCRAFLNGWTRKEALVKALGEPVAYPLARPVVSLQAAGARGQSLIEAQLTADDWSLCPFTPAPDYVGALAVEGHAWRATYLEFV